ncbi:MAG: pyridoxamine 5'-phosphate oxidase family protein [Hyphomicrobiales bacterium]|nr:pyridoxamine 5'-phosphate oxidase family protein [Hyphomicrobiales bacterium]
MPSRGSGHFSRSDRRSGSTTDMPDNVDIVLPPAARLAQNERGSQQLYAKRLAAGFPDAVTPELAAFIGEIDTAFLATVSAAGAPYVQHRGGPKGFIKMLDRKTLGFADYAGNRQYITLSNLAGNDHAFLFLLHLADRRRIKMWGRARVVEGDAELLERLSDPVYRARPERAILFTVEAWDVNCSQHITARFSAAEVAEATLQLRQRIAELEAENAQLRAAVAQGNAPPHDSAAR